MDEKIKTWTLRFPAKENPNMEKALFDWPIVLQYDVKVKYRLISTKFSGMTFFHPNVRWTDQKPLVRMFSFQGHTKIDNVKLLSKPNVFRGKLKGFCTLRGKTSLFTP